MKLKSIYLFYLPNGIENQQQRHFQAIFLPSFINHAPKLKIGIIFYSLLSGFPSFAAGDE